MDYWIFFLFVPLSPPHHHHHRDLWSCERAQYVNIRYRETGGRLQN